MISLYDLSSDLEAVINGGLVFDEETGEVVWDAENLEELKVAYNDKVEACGIVVKNLAAEAEAIRDEELKLAKRRRIVEKREERLRKYVVDCLGVVGGKLSTGRVSLSTRKSDAVEVEEGAEIPPEYVTERVTTSPNKALLRKALKSGQEIPGVELVERTSLVVR